MSRTRTFRPPVTPWPVSDTYPTRPWLSVQTAVARSTAATPDQLRWLAEFGAPTVARALVSRPDLSRETVLQLAARPDGIVLSSLLCRRLRVAVSETAAAHAPGAGTPGDEDVGSLSVRAAPVEAIKHLLRTPTYQIVGDYNIREETLLALFERLVEIAASDHGPEGFAAYTDGFYEEAATRLPVRTVVLAELVHASGFTKDDWRWGDRVERRQQRAFEELRYRMSVPRDDETLSPAALARLLKRVRPAWREIVICEGVAAAPPPRSRTARSR